MSKRGVVICGGGPLLLSALVNIQILRKHGCTLPVELWHFHHEWLSPFTRSFLRRQGVELRSLPRLNSRFTSKPYALKHSAFREVLLLDADNTPIRNPEFLFETKTYRETGALFWPDIWRLENGEAWRELADSPPEEGWEQESGQMVVDTRRHATALDRTLDFNRRYSEIRHLLGPIGGDKDTYQFAWRRERARFHMIPTFPGSCGLLDGDRVRGNTLVQHDLEGHPLFMHRNLRKWPLFGPLEKVWETIAFTRSSDGVGIHPRFEEAAGGYFHEFGPPQAIRLVQASAEIGNLEDDCLAAARTIRRRWWYQISARAYLIRNSLKVYSQRLPKRKKAST